MCGTVAEYKAPASRSVTSSTSISMLGRSSADFGAWIFFGGKTATKTTAKTEPAENGASTTKPRPTGKSLNTRGMRPLVSSWQKQRGLQSLVISQNNPKGIASTSRAFNSTDGMHTSSKGSIITSQGAVEEGGLLDHFVVQQQQHIQQSGKGSGPTTATPAKAMQSTSLKWLHGQRKQCL